MPCKLCHPLKTPHLSLNWLISQNLYSVSISSLLSFPPFFPNSHTTIWHVTFAPFWGRATPQMDNFLFTTNRNRFRLSCTLSPLLFLSPSQSNTTQHLPLSLPPPFPPSPPPFFPILIPVSLRAESKPTRMLSGLISRWTTWFVCMCCTPRTMSKLNMCYPLWREGRWKERERK